MVTRTICRLLPALWIAVAAAWTAPALAAPVEPVGQPAVGTSGAAPAPEEKLPKRETNADPPVATDEFDKRNGARLLRQIQQACLGTTESAWRIAGVGSYPAGAARIAEDSLSDNDKAALEHCRTAVDALVASKRTADQNGWSRSNKRQRERILSRCEPQLAQCISSSDCTELPVCVAAIENANCGSPRQCLNWLGRRLNTFQRQQELAARELMEQAATRRQAARIAAEDVKQRETDRAQSDMHARWQATREDQAIDDAYLAAETAHNDALQRTAILQGGMRDLTDAVRQLATHSRPQPVSDSKVVLQFDPDKSLALTFGRAAEIAYGIVTLPDSGVPRHRRYYELALRSLILGMGDAGYVLDSYYDPWIDYRGMPDKPDPAKDRWTPERQKEDARYGILVFRDDTWRRDTDPANGEAKRNYRVLLVVPETVTYGVRQAAFLAALWRIASEVKNSGLDHTKQILLAAPAGAGTDSFCKACTADACTLSSPACNSCESPILVIGPTFSGSVDSLARAEASFRRALKWYPLMPLSAPETLRGLRREIDELEEERLPLTAARDGSAEPEALQRIENLKALRGCAKALETQISPKSRFTFDGAGHPAGSPVSWSMPEDCGPLLKKKKSHADVGRRFAHHLDALSNALSNAPRNATFAIKAISATATATSNRRINHGHLFVSSLAVDDDIKLTYALQQLVKQEGIKSAALLYEPTSFGRGAVESLGRGGDVHHVALYDFALPPNIADLRKRLRDRDKNALDKLPLAATLPTDSASLPLEDDVENGNEYPDAGNSALTAVSADQQLRQLLLRLREIRPDMVIVAATDVRDRLYLFDRISRELSVPWRIDMEADLLLAHPDHVHGTRGVRMLASSPLTIGAPSPSAGIVTPSSQSVAGNGSEHDDRDSPGSYLSCNPESGSRSQHVRQFDSDRNALIYLIARCLNRSLTGQRELTVYAVGREGPILTAREPATMDSAQAKDSGEPKADAKASWLQWVQGELTLARGGVTSHWARWLGLTLLAASLLLLVVAIGISQASRLAPPAPQLTAPWWNRGRIDWNHAALLALVLALFGALVLPFALPLLRYAPFDDWRWLQLCLLVLAGVAQVLWSGAAHRFKAWIQHVQLLIEATGNGKNLPEWSKVPGAKPAFVGTPLEAGISRNLASGTGLPETPRAVIRQALSQMELGYSDTLLARMSLRAFLLPGLRVQCLLAAASLLPCFAVLSIAWLYPVPGRLLSLATSLVLFTLATTRLSGAAVAFERNGLLSRLFCGTEAGLQVSTQFIVAFAGPLVLLLLSLVATDQPGVLEIGGGIIQWIKGGK